MIVADSKFVIVSTDSQRIKLWRSVINHDLSHCVIVERASLNLDQCGTPSFCLLDIDSAEAVNPADIQLFMQKFPDLKFIVLIAVPDAADGISWLQAGAKAYANRLISPPVLTSVFETLSRGEIWAGKQVVQHLLAALQQPVKQTNTLHLGVLTKRQRELARCIANGLNNKQIAQKLGITERTVKSHLSNIFKKLRLSSRVQLALAVEQYGHMDRNQQINAA